MSITSVSMALLNSKSAIKTKNIIHFQPPSFRLYQNNTPHSHKHLLIPRL